MEKTQIDISVVLLTYNQESYIDMSLSSILNQKFYGTWEVIVGDDCSNDTTFKIIEFLQIQHPNLIKAYSNEKNLGLARSYEKAIYKAGGRYIAYLEGDDYWTDTFKLQKQFDFLETNPSFVMAFHDFVKVDESNAIISDRNRSNSSIQYNRSRKDMVTGCVIHQNTMMFRAFDKPLPVGFFKVKNHDTFFIAWLSKWGEAGYVKCSPLHYRIHSQSLWSSLSQRRKLINGLITYSILLLYVSPRYYGSLIWKIGSIIRNILIL